MYIDIYILWPSLHRRNTILLGVHPHTVVVVLMVEAMEFKSIVLPRALEGGSTKSSHFPPVRGGIKRKILALFFKNLKLASQQVVHHLLITNCNYHSQPSLSSIYTILLLIYISSLYFYVLSRENLLWLCFCEILRGIVMQFYLLYGSLCFLHSVQKHSLIS